MRRDYFRSRAQKSVSEEVAFDEKVGQRTKLQGRYIPSRGSSMGKSLSFGGSLACMRKR